ncbi:MAG: pyrroline-5-carboxylate reductase [Spirochaetales bacterium]|nr:pyrroline-5-carboxylate reductase [Spirochaetales bacterium]
MIGIIGYGNMGGAFCRGLSKMGTAFAVSERKADRAAALEAEQGRKSLFLKDLAAQCDILILAVKPQEAPPLLDELAGLAAGKRFISLMAGTPISSISSRLKKAPVCRFMPNLAALAGRAAVGVSFAEGADARFREECLAVARAVGEPFEIPERLMAAFTGLSGSGIAFVFAFLHALAMGGVATGIKYEESLRIALTVAEGAVAALRSTGFHPVELLSQVASPAGTTIKGLDRLERSGFGGIVMGAVEDASARAQELER